MPKTKTKHTTQPLQSGSAQTIAVEHDDYAAIQYDFYIPAAIWSHSATRDFIQRLLILESGATIFKGTTGIWLGNVEDMNIYRMILHRGKFDHANVRSALRSEIGSLYAKLSTWTESAQQAIMFTETNIQVTMARKLPIS